MYTCIGQAQIRIQFSGHVSALPLIIPYVAEVNAFTVAVLLVCMTLLTGAYSATALKLFAQGRAIRPRGTNARAATAQAATVATAKGPSTGTEQPPWKKRAMHIQALKIYTSIFLVFVVANAAATVVVLLDVTWLSYVYCINHTANPVIYYCFVEKFRNRVKEYCGRLIRYK